MLTPNTASAPSSTITTATPSSAIDNIAGMTFGSTSRNMTRLSVAPCARAAMTNSRCDHESALARVMRPSTGIETMPTARMTTPMRLAHSPDFTPPDGACGASTETSVSASTNCGNARKMLKSPLEHGVGACGP